MTGAKRRLLRVLALLLAGACESESETDPRDGARDAATDARGGSSGTAGFGANGGNAGAANAGNAGSGGTAHGGSAGAAGSAGSANGGSAGAAGSGGAGPNVDRSSPQLYELQLDPHVLDPTTVDSLSIQYAQLDTRSAPIGRLVVFLPGATNVPRDWRDHGRELAKFGFHVLIPHYNNRWSSGTNVCTGQPASCALETRWEALSGEDTSSVVSIARADSVEGRVVAMLKHLRTAQVGGDWGYYLDTASALRYADVVIAGISHGAASAGLYAARRAFSRAVLHSSGPAGDSRAAKLTPLSEWYAFAHTEDPAYAAIAASWASFGLLGTPTLIDGATAPYGSSHRLTSSAASTYPHVSTVAHSSSPKDGSGNYVFEPAWRYLYGVPPAL